MQYKLLASDFDNTLVPFGEPCPRPAVVKAVKKMQAAGGKFVLSTNLPPAACIFFTARTTAGWGFGSPKGTSVLSKSLARS